MEKEQKGQKDIPKSLDKPKEVPKTDPYKTDMIKQREELFNKYVECMKTNNYAVKECDYIIMLAKGEHGSHISPNK